MKKRKIAQPPVLQRRPPLADLLPAGELVVLYGERRMTVQGCRKILSYSPTEICLLLKKRRICVTGENLACSSFSGGCTTLQGRIRRVEYQNLEKGEKSS